jgi:peptidoglycan/LPS O-acetylase OafA/YrhL
VAQTESDEISTKAIIDGLRGIAILTVLFHHTFSSLVINHFPHGIRHGWLGVNLFFVLSGLVLFRPYYLGERSLRSWQEVLTFYRRRLWRLYPLFAISCIVSLWIKGVTYENVQNFFLTISALSAFTRTEFLPSLNWVLWSLVVEIWFSLFFPFVVWALRRFGYLRVGLSIFILSLATRAAGLVIFPSVPGIFTLNPLKDGFIGRFDDFFLGMLICHVFYGGYQPLRLRPPFLFGLGLAVTVTAVRGWDLMLYGVFPPLAEALLYNVVQLGFFLLIVGALRIGAPLAHARGSWGLRLHGAMCYSLYVWHGALYDVFTRPWSYLAAVYLVALVSFRWIEFGGAKDWRTLFRLRPG